MATSVADAAADSMTDAKGIADIAGEAVLLAGGGRAILMQLAHPAIGAGVAAHSDFAARPVDRLRGTLTYSYAVVYGDDTDLAAVRRRVNRAHAPVRSEAYNAFDPELQLWVAATLYDSALAAYEPVLGRLDAASADRVYAEWATVGTALQMRPELWPADRAAFDAYFAATSARLDVSDAAREVSRQLLHPPVAPPWLRAVMPAARLATTGLLPPALREAYRLPWDAGRARRFDALITAARLAYPRLPRRARFWPRDVLMRELRLTREAAQRVA